MKSSTRKSWPKPHREGMQYFEAMGVYKKVPYVHAFETTDSDSKASKWGRRHEG